jgi:hypothetical protein
MFLIFILKIASKKLDVKFNKVEGVKGKIKYGIDFCNFIAYSPSLWLGSIEEITLMGFSIPY